ncbi:MAG: hypothetical protein HPY44_21675 [Armatimonadetes bacterium]|nr:hypothetical protein [Armatimonadota bacterium]
MPMDSDKQEVIDGAGQQIMDGELSRYERIDAVGMYLDIPLDAIERTEIRHATGRLRSTTVYRFWVKGRCAMMPAHSLVSQAQFIGHIISGRNVCPRTVGREEVATWRDVVNCICQVVENVDADGRPA